MSRYRLEAIAEEGVSTETIILLLEKSTVQSLSWEEAFQQFHSKDQQHQINKKAFALQLSSVFPDLILDKSEVAE